MIDSKINVKHTIIYKGIVNTHIVVKLVIKHCMTQKECKIINLFHKGILHFTLVHSTHTNIIICSKWCTFS